LEERVAEAGMLTNPAKERMRAGARTAEIRKSLA
jgi:hypothetical protein